MEFGGYRVEFADILRIIEQFLSENGLERSLKTLQEESGVSLNAISDVEAFAQKCINGKWDELLNDVACAGINDKHLIDLYEQMALEMIEAKEMGLAHALIRQSTPLLVMREKDAERSDRLEMLLKKSSVSTEELYGAERASSKPVHALKAERRKQIFKGLLQHMQIAPPNRLIDVIKQSLLFQASTGVIPEAAAHEEEGFDLFLNIVRSVSPTHDVPLLQCFNKIEMPDQVTVECATFSRHGDLFFMGTRDGCIEAWNAISGKVRTDFAYQKERRFMRCAAAVLCLSLDAAATQLAAGCQDGSVHVWNVATGNKRQSFETCHRNGVTSVAWGADAHQLFSAGYDGVCRLLGVKSGSVLRDFVGHRSFVNGIAPSQDTKRLLSASSDGTVKVWDVRSGDCLLSLAPKETQTAAASSFSSIAPFGAEADCFVVCGGAGGAFVYLLNGKGVFFKTFCAPPSPQTQPQKPQTFLCAAASTHGQLLYAVTAENQLVVFDVENCSVVSQTPLSGSEIIGMALHPTNNVLVLYDTEGCIFFYRPAPSHSFLRQ